MSLFDFWTRRAPAPAPSEDWAVGDLGVCVSNNFSPRCRHTPHKEELVCVAALHSEPIGLLLELQGKPENHWFDARTFRKIRPGTEPATAEFTASLSVRPKVEA